MDTEDPYVFVKNLAYYVRTHEKALANALLTRRPSSRNIQNGAVVTGASNSNTAANASSTGSQPPPSTSFFSLPYLFSAPESIKPAKLSMTPNQLYYLLTRFEELGVTIGSMNIRLENIHAESSSYNYVSFLDQAPRVKGRSSDRDSLHSVSSIRSVMSNMSSMFSKIGFGSSSAAKIEKRHAVMVEDLKYLYSAFTKIPCLRLVADRNVRRIAGYEEFPFDTAVPTHVFKNVTELEICNIDFRSIFGWDRLAEQLRSLTVKRASLDDPIELLTNIVLDDMDKRRHRSSKPPASPSMGFNPQSPYTRAIEMSRSQSTPDSTAQESQRIKREISEPNEYGPPSSVESRPSPYPRLGSISPPRPQSSRMLPSYAGRPPSRAGKVRRRSSTSSNSSPPIQTPRTSSSNLLLMSGLQPSKWRFLRHLSLADNGLMSISSFSLLPICSTLQSLDLSSNLFTEIPDSLASLVSLRALNLSNCMIESLHCLSRSPLPAITVLNLRANRISSIAGIERLLSLERLDLRDNKLNDPTELARLTCMPEFRDVFVRHNPFTKTRPEYRILIFNVFRKSPGYEDDITIDGTSPSNSERRHLVDRVPEPAVVPVIQPPLDDEEEPATSPTQKRVSYDEQANAQPPTMPPTPQSNELSQSQRRRKGHRKRIVDITQDDTPRSQMSSPHEYDTSSPGYVTAVQTPVPRRKSSIARSATPNGKISTKFDGSPGQQLHNETLARQTRKDPSAADLAASSSQYKERIEALRGDVGSEVVMNGAPQASYAVHQMHRQGIAAGNDRLL